VTGGVVSPKAIDDAIEIEWQFDALDLRPVERWLAALPPPLGDSSLPAPTVLAKPVRRLVDRYLDTEDWRIVRAGFALRTRGRTHIRTRGGNDEVTLKGTSPAGTAGLRQRLEVTEALPAGGVETLGPDGPVGRRISALAGRHAFRQVLEVRTRRRPYVLRIAGEDVAEVALDDTVITAGPAQQPVRLRRVEVEVVPAWVDALQPLVDDLRQSCGLQPATLSKFEAGLLALGVRVPVPPDLGSTEVTPGSALGDLALAVIRLHLGVLLAREPGTRLGDDIEELHDMRVATRRLRAAIDFFVDALPVRAHVLRSELSWLAGVLGRVRDLDVQLDRMDEIERWAAAGTAARSALGGSPPSSPLEDLRTLLVAERASARRDLLEALDSPRWERLASGLVTMVQPSGHRTTPATPLAAAVLPDLVTSRHRAVVKAARRARQSGSATDFHRLRIRCKRLRYSLEFTASVYGGRTERFTRKLAKLQDSLGLLQDAEAAITRLADLATSAGAVGRDGGLPPRTVFAMGAVAERYRAESATLLARLPKRLAMLHGEEWRGLAAHMARRRLEALAASPAPGPARAVLGEAPARGAADSRPAGSRPAGSGPAGPGPAGPDISRGGTPEASPQVMTAAPCCPTPADTPHAAEPAEPLRTSRAAPVPSPVAAALSAWPDAVWAPPSRAGPPEEPPPGGSGTGGSGTGIIDVDKTDPVAGAAASKVDAAHGENRPWATGVPRSPRDGGAAGAGGT
jgi:CHAD domain-containing protein